MSLYGAQPARLSLVDGDLRIVIRDVPVTAADPLQHPLPAVVCRNWDPGAPDPRDAVNPRGGLDGVADSTAYTGARTVTLDLTVFGGGTTPTGADRTAYALVEQLTAMTHPTRRPYLIVQRPGPDSHGDPWRLLLRGTPFSISYGRAAATRLELTLNFSAPDGYFESPLRRTTSAPASDVRGGLILPFALPEPIAAGGTSAPPIWADINTSAPVAPVLTMMGPAANPSVTLTDGRVFAFNDIAVEVGQLIQVDMGAGTVLLNGQVTSPVYHTVDWSVSSWWRLSAPIGAIYNPGRPGGQLYIEWRDRRLTV